MIIFTISKMKTINFLASLLLHLMLLTHVSAINYNCYSTGNFTNTTYAKNRDILLSSLAPRVKANNGFYPATFGSGSNKVYVLAQCEQDSVYQDTCFACINSSAHELVSLCPNQYEAISWGGGVVCIIHYANRFFKGMLEMDPTDSGYNSADLNSNILKFDEIYSGLMDRTISKAASMQGLSPTFATGDTNLDQFRKIYVLMQCTGDMSTENCDACLRQSVSDYSKCCHGKQGGYVHKPNCFYRWDLYPFYIDIPDAQSPTPLPPPKNITDSTITHIGNGKKASSIVGIMIVVCVILSLALVALIFLLLRKRKRKRKQDVQDEVDDESTMVNCWRFPFDVVKVATDDFSDENKLGEGGFGIVYKGKLQNGQDIAVKRLSKNSQQGDLEFKNEVLLLVKLKHKSLVRLFGFCLEGEERLLIYEFVPNSSLDQFIFDPVKRLLLDWRKRYKIIHYIARGILYLHEDSRLKIIHRDLKASNILLDEEMNPKISDFGMARLFGPDQTRDNTSKIVGTFGYMAPEYALRGIFSDKSDVFSFGVLLLEIISGRRNTSFDYEEENQDLLNHAWKNWQRRTALDIVDPILNDGESSSSGIMRCIHIGLLCVQENAARRPTMASVVLMLSSLSFTLQVPTEPAFFTRSLAEENPLNNYNGRFSNQNASQNEISDSELAPR